jgi:formylmethanofuran dehydrogenase subunit C
MLVLRKLDSFTGIVDGSFIRPDSLSGLSEEQLNGKLVETDRGQKSIGHIFQIESGSSPNPDSILLEGDCSQVQHLGAGMQSGTLSVLGDVGDYAARDMKGGRLLIAGSVGNYTATGMRDGLLYVSGNVGDNLAAPRPGQKSGMRGGDVFIVGNVGHRACERMRRGTVFVAGNCEEYAASQMIAGSIIIGGSIGGHWGAGMRRGSLILCKDYDQESAAMLSEPRDFELSFLPLIWKHLGRLQSEAIELLGIAIANAAGWVQPPTRHVPESIRLPTTRWVRRQIGDLHFEGRGEVLVLKRISTPDVR